MKTRKKGAGIRGLSGREIKVVSYLELEERRFFSKNNIRQFFKSTAEINYFVHRLKCKGRIERINKKKYYLIPIQAYRGWAEHPFIVADEMFNGKDYYIGGKTAANYWGLIDQLPTVIDVFSTKRQGTKKILGSAFKFRRLRRIAKAVKRKIKGHDFLIASREDSVKWT